MFAAGSHRPKGPTKNCHGDQPHLSGSENKLQRDNFVPADPLNLRRGFVQPGMQL